MKHCPRCKQTLPLEAFGKHKRDGIQSSCRECDAARRRAEGRHPKQNKYARRYVLKAKYGLTAEDYDAMSAAQGGVCLICHQTNGNRRLAVDHDHGTGKIRGLLCSRCNVGIGMLRDDVDTILAAAAYVAAHKTSEEKTGVL